MKRGHVKQWLPALLASLLTACTVVLVDDRPPGMEEATQVTATSEAAPPPALDVARISQGEDALYRVVVPPGVDEPLLYVEAVGEGPLTLTVFDTDGRALGTSRTPDWFTAVLGAEGLEAQAIEAETRCLGPCVILEHSQSALYARVSTASAAPVGVTFFAYDQPYGDSTEPANDDCAVLAGDLSPEAILIVPEEGYQGAIETLGDRDCFRTEDPARSVILETVPDNTGIVIEAEVYDGVSGRLLQVLTVSPSDPLTTTGDLGTGPLAVRVLSSNARAGPTLTSSYSLGFGF